MPNISHSTDDVGQIGAGQRLRARLHSRNTLAARRIMRRPHELSHRARQLILGAHDAKRYRSKQHVNLRDPEGNPVAFAMDAAISRQLTGEVAVAEDSARLHAFHRDLWTISSRRRRRIECA